GPGRMAGGQQARTGGTVSLDECRSHACANGKSCWKCIVRATKAVQSCGFTVRRRDGARPCPARAYLALTPAPPQRRLVGQAPSWPIPREKQACLPRGGNGGCGLPSTKAPTRIPSTSELLGL